MEGKIVVEGIVPLVLLFLHLFLLIRTIEITYHHNLLKQVYPSQLATYLRMTTITVAVRTIDYDDITSDTIHTTIIQTLKTDYKHL